MRTSRLGLLLAVAIVLIAGSYLYSNLTASTSAEPADPPDTPSAATQIAFWESRIASNPGISSYTYLAAAHIRSAGTTGDITAYQRAEVALDKALAINPNFRDALFHLAVVRFSLHDFGEARAIAERLAAERRPPAGTILLLADIYLAVGEYNLAAEAIQVASDESSGPATLSRQAILADINGDVAESIRLMEQAADAARQGGALPENQAWFAYQVGHLYLETGQIDKALDAFERSDRLLPGYYLSTAGTADALVASGNFDEAIALYERLVAAVPQPEYLAALGDLYALQGDHASATEQYETVEFIAELGDGAYDRQFTNFLLDHDLRLDEALIAAERDIAIRQDILGWDTLAWALYKNERYDEAAGAISNALARGTQDPLLYYHAGMIHLALGDAEQARTHLEMALDINPAFDPVLANEASATVANLSER